jgi:hypothetical protein
LLYGKGRNRVGCPFDANEMMCETLAIQTLLERSQGVSLLYLGK